jgi:NADH-quinone oxidoreductase subunit C
MSDPAATPAPEAADEAAPAEELHGFPVTRRFGQRAAFVPREELPGLVRTLRDEGWLQCLDVTGVDYLAHRRSDLPEGVAPERFEVVVTLISHHERDRLRLRVQVPETDPTVPTLFEVHPGTEAMEREVFDMFGIAFEGHPDLTRILMPEDWEGHPLRKDYGIGRIPVQFKDAPGA